MDLMLPGAGVAWDAYDASVAVYKTVDAVAHEQYGRAAAYAAGGITGYRADFCDDEIAEDIQSGQDIVGYARKAPGMITRIERW